MDTERGVDGWTDGQADRRTKWNQYIPPSNNIGVYNEKGVFRPYH